MSIDYVRHKFTVEEYHRMAEVGILDGDRRVELIDGEVIEMSPIGAAHLWCVNRLTGMMVLALAKRAVIQVQNPVRQEPHNEPQPDISVLKIATTERMDSTPRMSDTLLAIEVADTSYRKDKNVKIPVYARAGIPECWIVVIPDDCIEVFRRPSKNGYRSIRRLGRGKRISPLRFPDVPFSVDDILG